MTHVRRFLAAARVCVRGGRGASFVGGLRLRLRSSSRLCLAAVWRRLRAVRRFGVRWRICALSARLLVS